MTTKKEMRDAIDLAVWLAERTQAGGEVNKRTLWILAFACEVGGAGLCLLGTWLLFRPNGDANIALLVDTVGVCTLWQGGRLHGRWEAR